MVYSEAYLLKALLCIIHDESVMSFLRESLHIRSSYNTYIVLEKYLNFVNEIKSKNKDVSKYEMDDNFTSGVSLGVGCFSLILSMLPASVIKVAEFIGFSSDRAHGLHVLESVGGWRNDDEKHNDGLRRELCDMILITYHVVLSRIAPLSDIDEGLAAKILAFDLNRFPKGVFFLYLNGRLMVSRRLLEEAKQQYQLAIDTQKDWKQLQHMCFWELGTISTVQKRWSDGFDIYDELGKESNWSKAVYTYLKAVSLYVMTNEMVDGEDKTKKMEQVKKLMEQVNGQKKKIAGKTIPMEVK